MAEQRQDREQRQPQISERPQTGQKRSESNRADVPMNRSARSQGLPSLWTDPFASFNRLRTEMDRIFDRFGFGGTTLMPAFETDRELWSPQVEMFERDNRLVVRADLPGLKKEDVSLEIRDDVLTIQGERKHESEESREGFFHTERSYGSFFRSIPLPEGINADTAQASFENGVLEITLDTPKRQSSTGRRIEISDRSTTGSKR